ncbi:Potassium voltage-gated channel subfamily B member 2 [Durusdinium trenchii]|uniref:Potassium voltage-gated channel subfamily B member 2 n=1 Tax=Durusdinium trenchii TaxID=1381693 RepID=A0ABP0Q7D5_9DINO
MCEALWSLLQRCAELHGNPSAAEVLHVWHDDRVTAGSNEDFLGAAIFTLAAAALQGQSLLEKEDSIVGVELCMGLAQDLDAAARQRLSHMVLERTLRRMDHTGDEIATKASRELLLRGLVTSPKECTQPLRSLLALLLRCEGEECIGAQELLELTKGDVALAVALVAEALAAPKPPGLPLWPLRLCTMLQQLTSPDVFCALVQAADPSVDFSQLPMADFRQRQLIHCQVIALSYVQFDVLGRALQAAEDQSQRQALLSALIRALHSLVGSCDLTSPGRLLSRCMSMDFLRLGFRFLAPFGRKLIEDSGNRDAAKVLRMLCRTFSWLMVHAGFDGSPFLAESLKPLAAEWLLRANKRGDTVKKAQLALAILAANTGAASAPPTSGQLEIVLDRLAHDPLFDFTEELQRWGAFTQQGVDTFYSLGFYVNCTELNTGEIDSDDDWPGEVDLAWRIAPPSLPDEGRPCHECGKASEQGQFGEGYFEGLWYCSDCWDSWEDAPAEMTTISPWPLESGHHQAPEQQGAAQHLLSAPGTFRCGISGTLMMDPVYIPASQSAQYPVAFSRRWLEKWHRRSGGRCPMSGAPLNLKEDVRDACDVTASLLEWLNAVPVEPAVPPAPPDS